MTRRIITVLLPAVAAAAAAARADDEAPAGYFSKQLGGPWVWAERVAAGPDGSVFAVARSQTAVGMPAAIDPPPDATGWSSLHSVTAFRADGSVRWTAFVDLGAGTEPWVRAVRAGGDGSVWLAGRAAYRRDDGSYPYDVDAWIARFEADGSQSFAVRIGGSGFDDPSGLVVTPEGDAIVVGTTWSTDFPVSGGFQSSFAGGRTDGFVARIRGDDGSVAWSTYLGGAGSDVVTAVTTDATGALRVARNVADDRTPYDVGIDYVPFAGCLASDLSRISTDGVLSSTTSLPHGGSGGVLSLAAAADGTMFVVGAQGYEVAAGWPSVSKGFALRLAADGDSVDAVWNGPEPWTQRVVALPGGDVLVGSRLFYSDPYYDVDTNGSTLFVLRSDLAAATTFVGPDPLSAIVDVDVAPDGAVCVVGNGLGVPSDVADPPLTDACMFVARIPLTGAKAPSATHVLRATTNSVVLGWTPDGDAAIRRDVEVLHTDYYEESYGLAAQAPGDAGSVTLGDLVPGETYQVRLVSAFASGVRTASPAIRIHTKPPAVHDVRATTVRTRRAIALSWTGATAGNDTLYEIERRIGGGRYVPVRDTPWDVPWFEFLLLTGSGFVDAVPPLEGVQVKYRVRAATIEGRSASRWAYSNSVTLPTPTLRVSQTSGRARASNCDSGVGYIDWSPPGPPVALEVQGTFGPYADEPFAVFDPMEHDLHLYFGESGAPIGVFVRAGSPLWRPGGLGWTWDDYGSNGILCHVEIGPLDGTFLFRACIDDSRNFRAAATEVTVAMSYAGLTGGDVESWMRLPGRQPNLVLR